MVFLMCLCKVACTIKDDAQVFEMATSLCVGVINFNSHINSISRSTERHKYGFIGGQGETIGCL